LRIQDDVLRNGLLPKIESGVVRFLIWVCRVLNERPTCGRVRRLTGTAPRSLPAAPLPFSECRI